uniref:Uncharacterized protein LOC105046083 n=1 Tax=Elaeis guineensis var. tenera TaxID=51953 RepID=A0A8N4IE25_ELAGV|nr:uncharacterized protein LOC105046083 [Elaeis guineensis]
MATAVAYSNSGAISNSYISASTVEQQNICNRHIAIADVSKLDWHFMVQGSKKIFNIFLKYLAFSKRSATTHACCSLTKLIVHKILLRFSLLVFSTHLNSDEIGIPRMGWQARRY